MDEAKFQYQKDGVEIFVYYCRWTPCALMHELHLSKNYPRERRDIKANAHLVQYYQDKGNRGMGNKESKRDRVRRARRRKSYMTNYFPMETWENEGGAIR